MRRRDYARSIPRKTRRHGRTRQCSSGCRLRSQVELLEDRRLLAVDVSFDPASGDLLIDDRLQNVNAIAVDVVDLGGGAADVRINQIPQGISPRDVKSISVLAGNGSDDVNLSAVTPFRFPALRDGQVTIRAGAGADQIVGSSFGDIIHGDAGDDTIHGGPGNDELHGQTGVDELHGNDGDDILDAGAPEKRSRHPVVFDLNHRPGNGRWGTVSVRFDQSVMVDARALQLTDNFGDAVQLTGSTFSYDDTTLTATWNLAPVGLVLPWYSYALDPSLISNRLGDSLDGNGDGVSGDPFFGKIVNSPAARLNIAEVLDFRVNSGGDSPSKLTTVDVKFGADVSASLDHDDLRLRHSDTGEMLVPSHVTWNAATLVASWSFSPPIVAAGYYRAQLVSQEVFDAAGCHLIGDGQNSANNYSRTLLVAKKGDLNLDGDVSEDEARQTLANVGKRDGSWQQGDSDGDSRITLLDALRAINNLITPPLLAGVQGMRQPAAERLFGGFGDDVFQIQNPKAAQPIEISDEGGSDTLDFSLVTSRGLSGLDLNAAEYVVASFGADTTTLYFMSPDAIENVVGTRHADIIIGNQYDNHLDGRDGEDRLEGGEGFDVLVGSSGNDTLIGQQGNDLLEGGAGNDTYVFEAGNSGLDTILEEDGAADRLDFAQLDQAVFVDLSTTDVAESRFNDQFQIVLASGQLEDVVGSGFDDVIYGNQSANWLQGGSGNDLILGHDGDDSIDGGAGADALDPGEGLNTVDPGSGFDDPEIQDTPSHVVGDFVVANELGALNQSMLVGGTATGIPPGATDKVTWSFDGLTAGEYELLTTWVSVADAATNTTFRIDGLLNAQVDQSTPPDGPIVAGFVWQSLGRFFYGSGTALDAELRGAGADGYVVADAVRLVRVGELPEISPLPELTIQASEPLSVPLTVTYPLGVLEDIELSLRDDAPTGVILTDPTISGGQLQSAIQWPASAARETGSFLISIVAVDREHPSRRVEETFWVTIGSPNSPPSLTAEPPRTVLQGDLVSTRFAATDADGPYWELEYSLGDGSPPEAVIDPESGWLSWDTANASVGTHTIEVIVTDHGNPPLSDQVEWSIELVHSGAAAALQAPTSQTIAEDSTLVFSTLLNNAVSLTGDGDEFVTLGIVAPDGTVQLSPAQGLTYELGTTQPTSQVKVRGNIDNLNAALNQLSFYPNADFRGQTVLRAELTDAGNVVRAPSLQLAEIPITVTAEVDAPTIPDQVLYFAPSSMAGALQVVGTVRAQDPDPDQWLSYRLATATTDFSIDAGTGRIIAANDLVLPSGEIELVVEAFYERSPTLVDQGVITIHRVPDTNSDPTIRNDSYSLQEDQFVSGNFLLGDGMGGFADYDPDGDAIKLVSVTDWQDRPIEFDVPHRVPSGATIVVSADGSFTFDASTSEAFDAGYFGTSQEDLYYAIADQHGATRTGGRLGFSVSHVNDLHTVANQDFSVGTTAAMGDRVGQLVVANAEPAESLDFAIVSGNPGNAFAIDYASGEVTVNSNTPLSPGQSFNLVVEVTDDDLNVVSALISVDVAQNLPPVVPDAHFLTAVDLPLSGNLLTELTGNGAAFDPDGGTLEVVTLDGSAYKLGRPTQLSSGATLTVNSDGSFTYDPSTSPQLRRLSADETRTERIEFTTRDIDGAAVPALLVITVGGRNWAPRAFDNLYPMSNNEELTGNLIHDFGTANLRDSDENSDQLNVVAADGPRSNPTSRSRLDGELPYWFRPMGPSNTILPE